MENLGGGPVDALSRLDCVSHCKTASGTNSSSRWTYRIVITAIRSNLVRQGNVTPQGRQNGTTNASRLLSTSQPPREGYLSWVSVMRCLS